MDPDDPQREAGEKADQESALYSKESARAICLQCNAEYLLGTKRCGNDGTLLIPTGVDPMVGSWLTETYRLESIIARGTSSVIYRGRHELMDRAVAVKVLHPIGPTDPRILIKRFQQEARAASSLNHPNIITIYDFGISVQGLPYLIMDYLEGGSLERLISQEGSIGFERAIRIFQQVCDAMEHAHHKGIVHRDIKPSNILFVRSQDDLVKVADFGIAKIMPWAEKQSLEITHSGQVFGSPIFMSPEQCTNNVVDERSDIYCLGATMYHALTGSPPHLGQSFEEIMHRHVHDKPLRFKDIREDLDIPESIEAVVFRALRKDPDERYQSMGQLRTDLDRLLREEGKQTSTIRILSVDDSEVARMALRAALSPADGIEFVGEAADGQSALDKTASLAPDVILMDINMSGMDGIESTRQIKKQFPKAKVIMLTASDSNKDIFAAFSAGADGYCLKSFSTNRLAGAIRAVAYGQAWLDPEISGSVLRLYAHTAEELLELSPPAGPHHSPLPADTAYLLNLAMLREMELKYSEAESLYLGAIALLERAGNPNSLEIADALTRLGDVYFAQSKTQQAEPVYLRALEIRHKLLGPEHVSVASSIEKLGSLFEPGEYPEVAAFFWKSFDVNGQSPKGSQLRSQASFHKLAWVYRAQKKYAEANRIEAQARSMAALADTMS